METEQKGQKEGKGKKEEKGKKESEGIKIPVTHEKWLITYVKRKLVKIFFEISWNTSLNIDVLVDVFGTITTTGKL
jgi:hypothetical protein